VVDLRARAKEAKKKRCVESAGEETRVQRVGTGEFIETKMNRICSKVRARAEERRGTHGHG
jgi:hypothetical protein